MSEETIGTGVKGEAIRILARAKWSLGDLAEAVSWTVAGVERELRWQRSRLRNQREMKRKLREKAQGERRSDLGGYHRRPGSVSTS